MIKEITLQGEIDKLNAEHLILCKNNPKDGFYKSNQVLKKAESFNYAKGIGESLRNLAFSSQLLGLIPEGYEFANRAVNIFEETGDKKNLAHVYHTLGFILDYLDNQAKRLEINMKCLELSRELKEEDWIIRTLNNTGDCHTKLKSYEDAIACFSECLGLLNREDTFMYSVVTCNLGEVYFCNGQIEEAKKHFELSKNNAILNNSKGIEITNMLFLSKCLFHENNDDEALRLLKVAIAQIEEIHEKSKDIDFTENSNLSSPALLQVSMDIEAEVYKFYGELCEKKGDLENALKAFKANKEIEEKLNKQKYTKEYQSIELRMEISHLENLVDERTGELEKTLSDLQIKEQNNRLVIENAVDSILFFNWDGKIIDYNRKSLNFFELESTQQEINISELLCFLNENDLNVFVKNLYSDEKNNYNTQRHQMKAVKSDLFFEVAFTKINTNGNSQGVAFISDITDKIKAEERKNFDLQTQITINKITQFLHDEGDYFQMINQVAKIIVEELKFDKCSINVQDETGNLIQIANIQNKDYLNELMNRIGDSNFIIENSLAGSKKKELVIPLRIGEKAIGMISVEKEDQNDFSELQTKILTKTSRLLSNRIDKIQEQKQKELLQQQLYEMNQKLEDEVHNKTKQINELTHKFHEHEKESLLADLAGSISHELNTPFGIINSGANALKDIVFEIIDLKFSSELTDADIKFAIDYAKANKIEKVISGRQRRKTILEFSMFLESKFVNADDVANLANKFVNANFPLYKTREIEFILNHPKSAELLDLISKIQQSMSFSETISTTSSRAADVVKELTKVARKTFDTDETQIDLKGNIDSVLSVYKYQFDDIEISVDINEELKIMGAEITLFQLWKNLVLFSSKNFSSDQSDKYLKINGIEHGNSIEIKFQHNGKQIDRDVINEIDSIQSIEDKVNPNINVKLSIIKKIVTDHQAHLQIDSSDGITSFSIIFQKK
ncbi:MAG: hypothetical protein ACPHF2_03075 [Crocinitomicaceae bacterium]